MDTPAKMLLRELYYAYNERGREEEYPPEQGPNRFGPPPGLWAVEELLADREPSFHYIVEIDSDPWLLVILDGAVHLLRFTSVTEAAVHVVGSLAGGTYTERLTFETEDEQTIAMRFEHPRLPLPGVLVVKARALRMTALDNAMRQRFRDWAASPPLTAVEGEKRPPPA